ncbi:dTDP-4-dehydrorhamnose 3,5-epimerase family protein [Algibacter sp. R77976]|uniref:dTDP-4-dehydrorhamnose 3,5-epimerase family protein n=1 Tax=Algibacter sp. R77976 TaxID=3093873 RepID=UPI0037C55C18
MNKKHELILGDSFSDDRGILSFCNNFSLKPIVRFYEIAPKDIINIRAWQAHKEESKWFYCTKGAFTVNLVKIDSFENPSDDLEIYTYELNEEKSQILYIPGGYANGFKAKLNNSKLMVFSDFNLNDSKEDDYRFETNKWIKKW